MKRLKRLHQDFKKSYNMKAFAEKHEMSVEAAEIIVKIGNSDYLDFGLIKQLLSSEIPNHLWIALTEITEAAEIIRESNMYNQDLNEMLRLKDADKALFDKIIRPITRKELHRTCTTNQVSHTLPKLVKLGYLQRSAEHFYKPGMTPPKVIRGNVTSVGDVILLDDVQIGIFNGEKFIADDHPLGGRYYSQKHSLIKVLRKHHA